MFSHSCIAEFFEFNSWRLLNFPSVVYKYHISVCYQLTFVFTGYYVYLSGEVEMNSPLLKIVYTLQRIFLYCHTEML